MDKENKSCINLFRNEYYFLSNFFIFPLTFENELYSSVEHAYQALKTLDKEERDKIKYAITPNVAKKLGRKVTLRPDWDNIKIDIMYNLLKIKFTNSVLKKQLLNTGDLELIEGNTWNDTFWGVDLRNGKGENWLGKLLMRVREEAKE